jgi:hypothetical protein
MKRENIEKADDWRRKHMQHVNELLKIGLSSFPPSEEDEAFPQLWKPGHWRWFIINA